MSCNTSTVFSRFCRQNFCQRPWGVCSRAAFRDLAFMMAVPRFERDEPAACTVAATSMLFLHGSRGRRQEMYAEFRCAKSARCSLSSKNAYDTRQTFAGSGLTDSFKNKKHNKKHDTPRRGWLFGRDPRCVRALMWVWRKHVLFYAATCR